MTPFTAQDKKDEAERELSMRRRVYPRWVADGRMTQEKADRQIAVMQAIRDDYAKLAEKDLLL